MMDGRRGSTARWSAWTSHVLTEAPSRVAADSIRCLRLSGSRRRDPGGEDLVDRFRRAAVLADEDELGVAAGDADFDVAVESSCVFSSSAASARMSWSRRAREDSSAPERSSATRAVASSPREATRGEVFAKRLDVTVDLHGGTMTSQ